MLLVHPVNELIRFLPVLIGVFVLGSSGDGGAWQLLGVGIPVALGLLRFLTTRFRITGTQIELRRGLLSRSVLTARLDRVRAVELTSSPIHRLLGLAKVEIGTGSAAKQGEEKFALDALALGEARDLRAALLHRVSTDAPESTATAPTAPHDVVLLRLDPRWVRYAPLTTSGLVIAAAVLAAFGQFADRIGQSVASDAGVVNRVASYSPLTIVVVAVVAFLVLGTVFGVLGYLVQNWGFTLARDSRGRSFHVSRGMFTSRETSLDVERVRGLEVAEPFGLRLAGAARLAAIVTGVSKKESGTTLLVPPAPRGVIDTTGSAVLEESEPLHLALVQHGPRARRRRWNRAVGGAALVPLGSARPRPRPRAAGVDLRTGAGAAAAGRPGRGGPLPAPRARAHRRLRRGALGHLPRPPRPAPAHRHHRLEPAPDLLPAPRRPGHPGGHHRRRPPGVRRPRHPRSPTRSPSPTRPAPGLLTPFLAGLSRPGRPGITVERGVATPHKRRECLSAERFVPT